MHRGDGYGSLKMRTPDDRAVIQEYDVSRPASHFKTCLSRVDSLDLSAVNDRVFNDNNATRWQQLITQRHSNDDNDSANASKDCIPRISDFPVSRKSFDHWYLGLSWASGEELNASESISYWREQVNLMHLRKLHMGFSSDQMVGKRKFACNLRSRFGKIDPVVQDQK